MNKLLRSFHTLLMMIVWSGSVLAQTSPYSYTFGTAAKADFTDENQTKQLGGIYWTLVSDAKNLKLGKTHMARNLVLTIILLRKPHFQQQTFQESLKPSPLQQKQQVKMVKYLFLHG